MAIRNQDTEAESLKIATANRTKLPTTKYVLKHGVGSHMHHAGPGEPLIINGGDIVELTAGQAAAFKDKFVPMAQVVAESEVARRTAAYAAKEEAEKQAERDADQARLQEEAFAELATQRAKLEAEIEAEIEEEKATELSAQDADLKAPSEVRKAAVTGVKK